jgi:hypothetical protein
MSGQGQWARLGTAMMVCTLAWSGCFNDVDLASLRPIPPPNCTAGQTCRVDADCSDRQYCNGVEECAPGGDFTNSCGCRYAAAGACGVGTVCNESLDRCFSDCSSPDADGDGAESLACGGADCDDNDAQRFPGNAEVCDTAGHDEDCDEATFGRRDVDSDGHFDAACCNGTTCGDDCDDTRAGVHPGSVEACDSTDNDCDVAVDEGVLTSVYTDGDRDGYGAGTATMACEEQPGTSSFNNDCDDTVAGITPGTFRCVGGNFPSSIQICSSNGTFTSALCPGQQTCHAQPNGTGVCF